MGEVEVSRRTAVKLVLGFALVGALGGLTAKESGSWGESEEDEPPSKRAERRRR